MKAAAFAAALIGLTASHAWCAERASPDDTARFLAGMPLPAESPLAPFTREPEWQRHSKFFDAAWTELERRQISKIRGWSEQNLKEPQRTLFYMFSGPDFLYANAFFPKATTYVMSALEPVGGVPEMPERLLRSLPSLRASLNTVMNFSFFISRDIRGRIEAGVLSGALPILYVFIARSGHTIRDVSLVRLDSDGVVHPADLISARQSAPGVRIVFSGGNAEPQTLYYFRTDLSDAGVKSSGFLKFCETLGSGDSLLKSTSYLMHSGNFSKVRAFVLGRSRSIVQDDSGIPVAAFKPDQWQLNPFGKYLGPIDEFPDKYQAKLRELFLRGGAEPIEFGIGYRWRPHESNVLLAVKKKRVEVEAR